MKLLIEEQTMVEIKIILEELPSSKTRRILNNLDQEIIPQYEQTTEPKTTGTTKSIQKSKGDKNSKD